MRRTFVRLCMVATIACAARAEAQSARHGHEARENARETQATGCLQRGSTPRSFVLQQQEALVSQTPAVITLVAARAIDLSPYIDRKVQVSGVMRRPGGAGERAAATRIVVREVLPVPGSCSGAQPAVSVPGTSVGTNPAPPAAGPSPQAGTTPLANSTTTTTTTGASDQTGVTGDALLDGLINFNIQQLLVSIQLVTNVQDTVINVSDVLNDFQIQALLQLLNSNPVASLNATELSFALQESGALAPGETVVGVTPPTVRDNKTRTKALQQQGILQAGERVVGAQGARVYKIKR